MGLREFLAERRARKLFPKKKDGFWYCGEMNDYQYELSKAGKPWKTSELEFPCDKFLINPYRNSGGRVPEESDVIPCIKVDGWTGYYRVVKKWSYSSRGSDFALWDDGYNVNLKFHHCERTLKPPIRFPAPGNPY